MSVRQQHARLPTPHKVASEGRRLACCQLQALKRTPIHRDQGRVVCTHLCGHQSVCVQLFLQHTGPSRCCCCVRAACRQPAAVLPVSCCTTCPLLRPAIGRHGSTVLTAAAKAAGSSSGLVLPVRLPLPAAAAAAGSQRVAAASTAVACLQLRSASSCADAPLAAAAVAAGVHVTLLVLLLLKCCEEC